MLIRRAALLATWASLAWACLLTGLAAIGNAWVLDRVSGGFFAGEVMPEWLRVIYGAMTLLMLGVARLAWLLAINDVTPRQRRLSRLVILVFVLSAVVNAISRSAPERWNALGAAITVIGFVILRRRPMSEYIDMRLRR